MTTEVLILTKRCSKCGEIKRLNEFYHDQSRRDGLTWWCKVCVKACDQGYRQTPEGKISSRAGAKRYRKTVEGRKYLDDWRKRSRQTPEGAEAHREEVRRWSQTPRGKFCEVKHRHSRRFRSTDPYLYAVRVELLHTLQESCAECGAPYKRSHQIDHIKALCNGGVDEMSNFQPICFECHTEKSRRDKRGYYGTRD